MMAALMVTHVEISECQSEPVGGSEGGAQDRGSDRDLEEEDERSDGVEEDDDEGSDGEEDYEDDGGKVADNEDGGEDDDEEGVAVEDEDGGDDNPNAGWAEAMAKILGKPTVASEGVILKKNRELEKRKEREKHDQLERKKQVDQKRAWEMMCRVKPDLVKDRDTERALQRVATRGVVQLFNAVRNHQRSVDEKVKEVGGSERKRAKLLSSVSKKDFIEVLKRSETTQTPAAPTPAEDQNPSWDVLRDDFMMGASMKDWDRLSDEEEGGKA